MTLQVLHRAALGSTASLGTLYDARTDTFLHGISVFQRDIPAAASKIIDATYSDVQFVHTDRISEKFERLNIDAEMQVSLLLGFLTLAGSGNYMSNKKHSARSVRSSLIYNIRTKNEILNIYHEDLKPAYSLDALGLTAGGTHFVSQIQWGANSVLMCEYSNIDMEDKTEISGRLSAKLDFIAGAIKGSSGVDTSITGNEKTISFKFRVFGDVMPDNDLPTTVEQAISLMKEVPRLLNSSNSGKGKPISYTLLPLSLLKDYLQLEIAAFVVAREISKSTLARVVKYFEALEAAEQLLFDLHSDVLRFRYCLQLDEISEVVRYKDDIDVYITSAKFRLGEILKNVRSGNSRKTIDDFVVMLKNHQFSPANITIKVSGWRDIQWKVHFARRIRSKGAKYLGSVGSLQDEKQDAGDKKLVVLYMQPNAREFDARKWDETTQLFFHQMLKNPNEQIYVVVDCSLQLCFHNKTTIYVVQGGVEITEDLLAEQKALEGRSVGELLAEPKLLEIKNSHELFPYTTKCPGRNCNKVAVYNWTCLRCGRTFVLGNDNYLYCECGQSSVHNLSYKCSDRRHGLQYIKHTPGYVQSLLAAHQEKPRVILSKRRPKDCVEVQEILLKTPKAYAQSGLYQIYPNPLHPATPVEVYCDLLTDGGGWTVFQRRMDTTDFYRNWEEYTLGFGRINGSHWLGLKTLMALTTGNDTELRVDLEDFDDQKGFGVYQHFHVANEAHKFRLDVSEYYSGNIGDSLARYNGMAFSTKDNDNDNMPGNWAQQNHGGWWYNGSLQSNLNGLYHTSAKTGWNVVHWSLWKRNWISLKRTEMKIRKRSFKPTN